MKNKIKLSALILVVAIVLSAFSGCGSVKNLIDDASKAIDGAASGIQSGLDNAVEDPETAKVDKGNAYIDASNELQSSFYDALDRYESYYGWEDEIIKTNPGTIYSMGEYKQKTLLTAEEFASKEPAMPMDDVAKTLMPKMVEIYKLIDTMEKYYEMKNYVDDNFEKGAQYHKELISKYNDVEMELTKFLEDVHVMAVQNRLDGIEKAKTDGLLIEYHLLSMFQASSALSDYLFENDFDETNVQNVNLEEFQPYYDKFVEHVNGFMEASADTEQAEKESYLTESSRFSSLTSSVTDLKKCATEMYEIIRDNGKVDIIGHGSPEEFDKIFGDVIDNYNWSI